MVNCVVDVDKPRFGGETFDEAKDGPRLRGQLVRVRAFMTNPVVNGHGRVWWTLRAIADQLDYPEASISARLRDLRHEGFDVQRRRVHVGGGTWEYRVVES